MFDKDYLQGIIDNIDLRQYVSSSVDLEQRGEKLWGRCVFHEEKTPSMMIDEDSYHCFGCGAHGNIFKWMMDYEGLSFHEAVSKAASLAEYDDSGSCHSTAFLFNKSLCRVSQPHEEAEPLPESAFTKFKHEYRDEWLKEGITKEAMDFFEIRFDPTAGRIVYPVRLLDGTLIGVKGRTIYDNKAFDVPKYMNYYKLGRINFLQGLNHTRQAATERGELILFEGIKSVMKAWSWGYTNAASVESHHINNDQIKIIVELGVDVTVAFDSDVSFQSEALKHSMNTLARFTNVYYIEDTEGLLGGAEAKNAPVDLGKEVWETLYNNRKKWTTRK